MDSRDDNQIDWEIFSLQESYRKRRGILVYDGEMHICLQNVLHDLKYFKELLDNYGIIH